MTPEQQKQAVRMYRAYQTDTQAFRDLAEEVGMTVAQLTKRCWFATHPESQRPSRQK